MCDHLYDDDLPARLLATPTPADGLSLACDFDIANVADPDDAMKVKAADHAITAIRKDFLDDWNCVDTGVMRCTPALFEALREAAGRDRHAPC